MAIDYYVRLVSSSGTSPYYAISGASFAVAQGGLDLASSAAGKLAFDSLNLTVGSGALSQALDQAEASGKPYKEIDLFAVKSAGGTTSNEAFFEGQFKLAGVSSDGVTIADDGSVTHNFSLQYGALVESYAVQKPDGTLSTPLVGGWNRISNKEDTDTTVVGDEGTGSSGSGSSGGGSGSGSGGSSGSGVLPKIDTTKAISSTTAGTTTFVEFRDATGKVLGSVPQGAGWAPVTSVRFGADQTVNFTPGGFGAGKLNFSELSLSFAPGAQEPSLFSALASGSPIQIELATYAKATGNLVDDYRFGGPALVNQVMTDASGSTYNFQYAEAIYKHYDGTQTPTTFSWDASTNTATVGDSYSDSRHFPTQNAQANDAKITFDLTGGATSDAQYYLRFSDNSGNLFKNDGGGTLYAVSDVSFSAENSTSVSITGGTTAGKVSFGSLTYTIQSSALTQALDQAAAQGKTFGQVELIAFQGDGPKATVVVDDIFAHAGMTSDLVAFDGYETTHKVSMQFDGLSETITRGTPTSQGSTVTAAWNTVTNTADDGVKDLGQPQPSLSAVVAQPSAREYFVQFRTAAGAVLSGTSATDPNSWISVSSLNLGTLQTGSSSSPGKLQYTPLQLTFAPGLLEPTLLQAMAQGKPIEIEVAGYTGTGSADASRLVDDYRFGPAAISEVGTADDGNTSYSFVYGTQASTHYPIDSNGRALTPATFGFDTARNVAIAADSAADDKAGISAINAPTKAPSGTYSLAGGGDADTDYYLRFTSTSNDVLTGDGGPLYAVSDVRFGATQTVAVAASGGLTHGKISFGDLSFTIGASNLAQTLQQMEAAGTTFQSVELIGFGKGGSTAPIVVHDTFNLVGVASDKITVAGDGDSPIKHQVTLQYGGLVESISAQGADGKTGKPRTAGWNAVKNAADDTSPRTDGLSTNSAATPSGGGRDIYVQFRTADGKVITNSDSFIEGAKQGEWTEVESASLGALQNLAIGSGPGSGAGKIAFDPLQLTFRLDALAPAMLGYIATGTKLEIEVAVYSGSSGGEAGTRLVDDYRFGGPAVASGFSFATGDESPTTTYSFNYGTEVLEHYSVDPKTGVDPATEKDKTSPVTYGWNALTSKAVNLDPNAGSVGFPNQAAHLDGLGGSTKSAAGIAANSTAATTSKPTGTGGAQVTYNVTQGKGLDGYLKGATVFGDANGDGVLDNGEVSTTTDDNGNFTLTGASGPVVLVGGTDITTGLANTLTYQAPAGSSIVSPLTTVVQAVAQTQGLSTADANASVVAALGLGTGTDLTTLDAQAGATAGDPTATAVFAAQVQAANVFDLIQGAGGDLTSPTATAAIAAAFTTPSSLTDPTSLAALATSAGVDPTAAATLANTASNANATIAAAATSGTSTSTVLSTIEKTAAIVQGASPSLAPSSFNGTSPDFEVTRLVTPTVTGAAPVGATVTLLDTDQTVLGSAMAGADGTYTITSSTLDAGFHTLTVKVTDGTVTATSGITTLLIDLGPKLPSAPVLAPGTGASPTAGLTKSSTPTVTGIADPGAAVTLYSDDAVQVGTGTADQNGNYTITTSALSDGRHALYATSTDSYGIRKSGISGALYVTVEASAPSTPDAPTLANVTGAATNLSSPTLTGTTTPLDVVTLYDENNNVLATTYANSAGAYSIFPTTPLADGLHTLSVTTTDAAGNISSRSDGTSFTISTAAPAAPSMPTLVFPSNHGSIADGAPAVTGTSTPGTTVTLYRDEAIAIGSYVVGSDGTYSITPQTALADGRHQLYTTATDALGNVSVGVAGVTYVNVQTTLPSASAPVLAAGSDTGTLATDGVTNQRAPDVTGTTVAGAPVALYDTDGTLLGSATARADGSYEIASSVLSEGQHTLSVVAFNVIGGTGPRSDGTTITIDTTAPAAPTLGLAPGADTGASPTDGVTDKAAPGLTGTTEANATVSLYRDDAVFLGSTVAGKDGGFTFSPTQALADGRHILYAMATDAAGNRSAAGVTYATIDTQAPAVTVDGDDTTVTSASQTITGTGDPFTSLSLSNDDGMVGTTTVGKDGTWSQAVTLSPGDNHLVATDTDRAGNIGTSTAATITYTPADTALAASLNSLVQALSTAPSTSSGALTPTAPPPANDSHLAAPAATAA